MDRGRLQRIIVVLTAALLMTWPAFYNRYPLLYPDSMSYLEDGARVARALFLRLFSYEYGRSPLYSLVLLPLHRNITPWPIIALNAILTAYVLWLVVRSLLPRRTQVAYLGLVAALCLGTGLAWFVSWIMPDILGPVLYLSVYLMVFAWDTLSRAERAAVVLLAWWAVASHASHLILAAGLCVVLGLFLLLQRRRERHRLRAVGRVAVVVGSAAAAELALNAFLYGEPSLNGRRPPFLMARVIADGPGRWYLERHCGAVQWAICDHVHRLPDNARDFLWAPGGIWLSASGDEQDRLRAEEGSLVIGVLREYPGTEVAASAVHYWEQLRTFGLWDFAPDAWTLSQFDAALPGARATYLRSRQAEQHLPEEFLGLVQEGMLAVSVAVIGLWALLRRSGWSSRLTGLAVVIGFVVIANAAVTGILSEVEDRYQARVIWLVPLLAGLLVLTRLDQRRPAAPATAPPT